MPSSPLWNSLSTNISDCLSRRSCRTCDCSQASWSIATPSTADSYESREILGKVSRTRKSAKTFHVPRLTRRQICILVPFVYSQHTQWGKPFKKQAQDVKSWASLFYRISGFSAKERIIDHSFLYPIFGVGLAL